MTKAMMMLMYMSLKNISTKPIKNNYETKIN